MVAMKTQDIVEAMAKRLRGAKGEANMTDAAAGDALGKSRSTVQAMIANPGNARVRDLLDLLETYGKDPDEVWAAAFEDARR